MKKKFSFPTTILLISTGIIFVLLTLTMIVSNLLIIFLSRKHLLAGPPDSPLPFFLIQTGMISILTGTILTLCLGHLPLRPFRTLMQAIREVSEGNFDVKINIEHPRELRELSRCFNQMTEELSGIQMLHSDFINNFSHELKTPVVSILGFARLIRKGNLSPEEQKEYLDIIIDESNRLAGLSASILNLSKIESMSCLSDFTSFNVSEQIREAIVLLENKWAPKNISFDLNLGEIQISGSSPLLKEVWVNLIDNAVKFSPENGTISITVNNTGTSVTVAVTDHGAGIDPKTQKYMFDKFYQSDTSHSSQGNGLGLALVKKIVKLHGGQIRVKSSADEGSTFYITLPATRQIT